MVLRNISQRRGFTPIAAIATATGLSLYSRPTVYADAPEQSTSLAKKSIYDEPPAMPSKSVQPKPSKPKPDSTIKPTPTDRLAGQIRKLRLSLYQTSLSAEKRFDGYLSQALQMEASLAGTVTSLAPSPQSGEKLLPGSIYVLVAAMAGSIITRNRNILLRFSIPLAAGIGAGWVVLPNTMQNISDLSWEYEKQYPIVRDAHLQTKEAVEHAWGMTRMHSELAFQKVEEGIGGARESVRGWISGKK